MNTFSNNNMEQQAVAATITVSRAAVTILNDESKEEQVETELINQTDAVFTFLTNRLEPGQSMSVDVLMKGMAWMNKTEKDMLRLLGTIEWAGNIKVIRAPSTINVKLLGNFKLEHVHKAYSNKKRCVEELREQLQQVNKRLARAEQEVAACLDSFHAIL